MEKQRAASANFDFLTDEMRAALAEASADKLSRTKPGLPTEAASAAKVGGARRDRTDDLLLAKQALSQLSYGPSSLKLGGPGKI